MESVSMVTELKFKLRLFLELKTHSFPHHRLNKLRIFTKPSLGNGAQNWRGHDSTFDDAKI